MPYATLDDLKEDLGLAVDDGTLDAYLTRRLNAATSLFEALTGRIFSLREHTEKIAMPLGRRRIILRQTPVVSITSIAYKEELLDASDYFLDDSDAGFVARADFGAWKSTAVSAGTISQIPAQQELNLYTVVYTAGFSSIPFDIQEAILSQASLEYNARGRDKSVASMSVLGDSVSYVTGVAGAHAALFTQAVERYRRLVVL